MRKRDGSVVPFDKEKLTNAVFKAVESVGGSDRHEAENVAELAVEYLSERFKEDQIPSVEDVQDCAEKALIEKGHATTAKAYILYRHRKAMEREMKKLMGVTDDLKLSLNAIKVLERRYLLKNEEGKTIETPGELFRRVAHYIASAEKKFDGSESDTKYYEDAFFNIMKNFEFIPNSPTLMNAGTDLGQLSACFVLSIEDNISSIFDTVKHAAMIHQTGGGTGFCFSYLRPKGDFVKSTAGVASGPISFMTVFDHATNVIKQGGCISSKSLVRTNNGVIQLGELINCPKFGDNQTNSLVYTNGEFHNAFIASDNGFAETYCIKTNIGTEISSTYNHPIGVIDENGKFGWKEASNIKKGDWIIHVLGGHAGSDVSLPKIGAQHPNANVLKTPDKMNADLAELLGIYMADGCISSGGRIIFAVEESEIGLQERIKSIMKTQFGLELGRIEQKENDASICMIFYSNDLCEFFHKVGWSKDGAKNAHVPSSLFKSSKESAFAFLRGLFEGDGDIHTDGYPRLYTVSETLAKDVQQLLFGLGIVSSFHSYNSKNKYGKLPIYHLTIIQKRSVDEFIKNVNFISPKKQKRLLSRQKTKAYESYDVIPNQETLLRELYCGPGRGSGKGRSKRGANREFYRAIQHFLVGINSNSKRNLTRKKLKELFDRFEQLHCDQLLKVSNDEYFYSQVSDITMAKEYTAEIEVPTAEQFVANSILVHNKRRGANMGVLHIWHPDIEEFITAKQTSNFLENFNVSVAIDDKFMHAVESDAEYELINPRNKQPIRKIKAESLFNLIAYSAWKAAEPGVLFIDTINRTNPTPKYEIHSTNPCVTGDTLIKTKDGSMRICDLNGSEEVLTLDGNYHKISWVGKTGEKEIWKVTTENGYSVCATRNHKFFVEKHGWNPLSELSEDDKLITEKEGNIEISKIKSIEKIGIAEVFDATEPVTHSFFANGILVHNCGEVPMPDYESCNLGSVNLEKFVDINWSKENWRTKIQWKRLREVIRTAVVFLDNVVELNKYPLERIKQTSQYHRRIGLGVMGFANMLLKIGTRYDSHEAYEIAEEIMKFVTEEARKMSHELGRARGSFPGFKESAWDKKIDAMRNATVTSIAPTGTISMIADTSSGIEPLFAIAYMKNVMDGTKLYYINEVFEQILKVRGIYSEEIMQKVIENGSVQGIEEIPKDIRDVFVISYDILAESHLRIQAAFQKYTDLAVSKTINLPNTASVEDVKKAYFLAWKLGCKGVTVYRDGSRGEQVLNIIKKPSEPQINSEVRVTSE